jgi:hypothetical protein
MNWLNEDTIFLPFAAACFGCFTVSVPATVRVALSGFNWHMHGAIIYAVQAAPVGLDVFTVRVAAGAVLNFAFPVFATQLADNRNS